MKAFDYVVNLSLSVVLIVGAYQFYFWCQRRTASRLRVLDFPLENKIPLRPSWVWIYSGLYYPMILYTNLTIQDMRRFNYIAFSYLVLLLAQMLLFLLVPIAVPKSWRETGPPKTLSERFLRFVQRYDARSNCFPSMHVSVATLTALHLDSAGVEMKIALSFPILIAISAIWTKQHYLVDLAPGGVLGYLSYRLFLVYY